MAQIIFVIFLGIALHGTADSVETPIVINFTSKPDDVRKFVGTGEASVTFKWTYVVRPDSNLKHLKFGYVEGDGTFIAVVVKSFKQGRPARIIKSGAEVSRKDRIETKNDKKAEFTFKDLKLNDTGNYFCMIGLFSGPTKHSTVWLQVEDLEINGPSSSHVVEAWKDHQITLRCVVNVADGVTPVFEWRRESDNSTVNERAKQSDERQWSTLKLYPHFENEFDNYICIARTTRTTKTHKVMIRRLYEPDPPRDLQRIRVFEKNKVYPKVSWKVPNNGGSPILKYIVEFKPVGIEWTKATKVDVNDTAYLMTKIKPGKSYDVRVFAKNKVNRSKPSNNLNVKFAVSPNAAQGTHSTAARWTPRVFTWLFAGLVGYLVSSKGC